MKELNVKKMLSFLIVNRRNEVINALAQSDVYVSESTPPQLLADTVMSELNNNNEKLINNLGRILDNTFDFSPLLQENKESFSNSGGVMGPPAPEDTKTTTATGDFIRDNKGTIVDFGAGLIKWFVSKNDKGSSTSPTQTGGSSGGGSGSGSELTNIYLQQERERAERERRAAESSKKNTWIAIGVGAVLLTATIITIVVVSKNKSKN